MDWKGFPIHLDPDQERLQRLDFKGYLQYQSYLKFSNSKTEPYYMKCQASCFKIIQNLSFAAFEGIDNYLQKRTRILFAVTEHQVQRNVIVLICGIFLL